MNPFTLILISVILLAIPLSAFSSDLQTDAWIKKYGIETSRVSSDDIVKTFFRDIETTRNGNNIALAKSTFYDEYDNYTRLTSIFQLNPSGNITSEKHFFETYPPYERIKGNDFNHISALDDGGFVIHNCGKTYYDQHSTSLRVAKLNQEKEIIWAKEYSMNGDNVYAQKFILLKNGGFLAAGKEWGDAWVMQLDSDGEVLWNNNFIGRNVLMLQENNLGYILSLIKDDYLKNETALVQLDHKGEIIWQIDINSEDRIAGITQEPDGDFIITVTQSNSRNFGNAENSINLIKMDSQANIKWQKKIAFGQLQYLAGWILPFFVTNPLIITKDHGILLYFITRKEMALLTVPPRSVTFQGNVEMIKFDTDGNVEWKNSYGANQRYQSINGKCKQTADEGFIMAGYSGKLSSDYPRNEWIMKVSENGTINACQLVLPSKLLVTPSTLEITMNDIDVLSSYVPIESNDFVIVEATEFTNILEEQSVCTSD